MVMVMIIIIIIKVLCVLAFPVVINIYVPYLNIILYLIIFWNCLDAEVLIT